MLKALACVCHDVYLKGSLNALFKEILYIMKTNIKILKDQRSLGTFNMVAIATSSFKSGLLEELLRYSPLAEDSECLHTCACV